MNKNYKIMKRIDQETFEKLWAKGETKLVVIHDEKYSTNYYIAIKDNEKGYTKRAFFDFLQNESALFPEDVNIRLYWRD